MCWAKNQVSFVANWTLIFSRRTPEFCFLFTELNQTHCFKPDYGAYSRNLNIYIFSQRSFPLRAAALESLKTRCCTIKLIGLFLFTHFRKFPPALALEFMQRIQFNSLWTP